MNEGISKTRKHFGICAESERAKAIRMTKPSDNTGESANENNKK